MSRILVAYASKHGSTAEIAAAIAETLRGAGIDVDCTEAGAVGDLAGYDAVVLGSAVYLRRWRGDAKHFLRHHADALARMPFWVFSSGPVGDPAEDDPAWNEPHRLMAKAEGLGVREHVIFGGRATDMMAKDLPEEWRDRRDWDAIRAWAAGIASEVGARVA
jgi:menaquinone-dependent protoporphyrinogen oxidase